MTQTEREMCIVAWNAIRETGVVPGDPSQGGHWWKWEEMPRGYRTDDEGRTWFNDGWHKRMLIRFWETVKYYLWKAQLPCDLKSAITFWAESDG